MPTTKVKVEAPTSVILSPNGSVSSFGGNKEQRADLTKSWIVVWLESLEEKGINPLDIGRIETVVNGELVRIKPFKKEGVWGYDSIVLENYIAHQYERMIELNETHTLIGFDTQDEMVAWIQKWNSMDGEGAPPFFDECCAYKGKAEGRDALPHWVERKGFMESGGYWYKSYDGDVYCKNHCQWSFESALKVVGNPKYIIVLDKSKTKQQ